MQNRGSYSLSFSTRSTVSSQFTSKRGLNINAWWFWVILGEYCLFASRIQMFTYYQSAVTCWNSSFHCLFPWQHFRLMFEGWQAKFVLLDLLSRNALMLLLFELIIHHTILLSVFSNTCTFEVCRIIMIRQLVWQGVDRPSLLSANSLQVSCHTLFEGLRTFLCVIYW